MSIYSKLYWLTRLDGIQGLFIAFAVIAFVAAIVIVVYVLCSADFVAAIVIVVYVLCSADFDEFHEKEIVKRKASRKSLLKKINWIIPLGFVFTVISILIPNKNEMIFIVAGGKTIDWVQKDTSICKIPSQTTAIISDFLDKQIKKMNEKSDK